MPETLLIRQNHFSIAIKISINDALELINYIVVRQDKILVDIMH